MKTEYKTTHKKGLADAVNATLSVVIMVAVAVFGAIFVASLKNSTTDTTAQAIATSGQTLLTNIMTYLGILVLAIFFGLALRYLTYYIGGVAGVGRGGE
jgi:uncharacterized membrane protein